MESLTGLAEAGTTVSWFLVPSAILLGALHGLEPGHSKTMMAAFIVAIRGTIGQAVLLALTATISHTAIVWVLAILALTYGGQWSAEANEPYFQLASGALIIGIALWMLVRTWREQNAARSAAAHSHGSGNSHGAHHHDETKVIDTGHGLVALSVFEEGVPPRFQLHFMDEVGHVRVPPKDQTVTIETIREGGKKQLFHFVSRGDYLEASSMLPEPHEFKATLTLAHQGHAHTYDVSFTERDHEGKPAAHGHDHGPGSDHSHQGEHSHEGLQVSSPDSQDAHQRAHAMEIQRRFANRSVTTGQVAVFGLTGGLLPCSAAVTVLILCLQLQRFWLGMALVLCFSIGLALTLLASGVFAAWGMRHVSRRWTGFDSFARRAPYFSSAVVVLIGLYVAWQGFAHLPA